MKTQLVRLARSPRGGASLIAELLSRDPEEGKTALDNTGEEVLNLMSRSPADLADLFEWVDDDFRRVLWSKWSLKSLGNMTESPGDWERIRKSIGVGVTKSKWSAMVEIFRGMIKERLGGKE